MVVPGSNRSSSYAAVCHAIDGVDCLEGAAAGAGVGRPLFDFGLVFPVYLDLMRFEIEIDRLVKNLVPDTGEKK